MQFQKHNFAHNFLNAVETDKPVAWDILVNEINEVIIEFPKTVEKVLRESKVALKSNPSRADLLNGIHDHFYDNGALQNKIMRLIGQRHNNPHFNANGGAYDRVLVGGVEKADFNMNGDAPSSDEGTFNFTLAAAKSLVQNVKTKAQAVKGKIDQNKEAIEKAKIKAKGVANLQAKEKQRDLPGPKSGGMSVGKIVGLSLAAAGVISLVAFLIYKANKKPAN